MLKRAILWLRSNIGRRRYEREMRDEMNEHLDRATRLLMERGMPAEDARRHARREFGDVAYHQTEARDARGTLWLDDLRADARFAFRHFARKPGTTFMMFVVLAAGMSVSTILFAWVRGLTMLPPAAVSQQDDLVRIRGSESEGPGDAGGRRFQEDEFLAYRGLTSHFSSVAGWIDQTGVMQVPNDPEQQGHNADLTFVTENYFTVIGVQPILGRGLPSASFEDQSANAVAVIDYDSWTNVFEQRRDIVGSTMMVNGRAITIVGVAPERFVGLRSLTGIQLWLPVSSRHALLTSPDIDVEFEAAARLRPGVTPEAATAAVRSVAARFDTTAGRPMLPRPSTEVVPVLAANNDPEFDAEMGLISLMFAALGALVLAVTCTNVSALLTGLASARRQEIAVRLSLGAARGRIIRQLLTESAVLALIAGAAALGLVGLILKIAVTMVPEIPVDLRIEWPTAAFTFSIALAVGVLFGLSPALHATRLALAGVLRDSTGGIASSRARLQRGLVVAQIAFTQPLIVVMATMLVFVAAVAKPSTGSDVADRVIRLGVETPSTVAFDVTPESVRRQGELMQRLRDQLLATPGIKEIAMEWPGMEYPGEYTVRAGDEAGGTAKVAASVAVQDVDPSHFDVLGIPITSGRTFTAADRAAVGTSSEVPAVIGTDLAALMWGNANPVGRRLQITPDTVMHGATLVVVGVVDDPVARTRVEGESYRIYQPAGSSARPSAWMLVRTDVAAAPLLPTIRGLVQKTAGNAIISARTLAEIEEGTNSARRQLSGAISAAGIAALILSAIGLYAVIAFSVTQRTQEIAVRLAVGASGNRIATSFVRDGLRLGAFGLLLGLPAGMFAVRQLIVTMDLGQLPIAPIVMTATAGIIIVAAASAWGPARRAASVDPATALRRG